MALSFTDSLIWQGFASVIIPGFTINRLCRLTGIMMKHSNSLPPFIRKWGTAAVGLGCIPFIVRPIDWSVDYVMDRTCRVWYDYHPRKSPTADINFGVCNTRDDSLFAKNITSSIGTEKVNGDTISSGVIGTENVKGDISGSVGTDTGKVNRDIIGSVGTGIENVNVDSRDTDSNKVDSGTTNSANIKKANEDTTNDNSTNIKTANDPGIEQVNEK